MPPSLMEHPSVLGRISNKGIFTSDSTDFRSSSNDANEKKKSDDKKVTNENIEYAENYVQR